MAYGRPKRNGRGICGHRGQCSCQRRINAELAANPKAAPRTCTIVCQPKRGACGATIRGGYCPCAFC